MENKNDVVCLCPLGGVIDVISKKGALLIINAVGNYGSLRFNRLMEAVIPILKWAATRQCSKRKKCSAAYSKIPAHRIRNKAANTP
jgi:DNA-binding HxlR family transcriptional regulator